jgi:hypothetical protein
MFVIQQRVHCPTSHPLSSARMETQYDRGRVSGQAVAPSRVCQSGTQLQPPPTDGSSQENQLLWGALEK